MNVLLGTGAGAGLSLNREGISRIWSHLPNLEWVAVTSAGVTNVLAPELVDSDVTLTNAKVACLCPLKLSPFSAVESIPMAGLLLP